MANRRIAHAVRTALMTAGAIGAASAGLYVPTLAAQEALDEIIVTGSRIARRDNIAESPIFTVDQGAMRVSGYVTVEQYLNTLPQVVPSISSQSNNPSSLGRAFIDLRGLGSNRNLVLIDGRRAMGQASGGTVVDVNTIPAALVERVEIISGGAAAVYGPDAIAGVVNFIMKKSFDGVAIDGQYRLTEQGDGEEIGSDLTFGGDFANGRGSAVFNANYFKRQAMYKGARGFAAQAQGATSIFPNGSWNTGTNTPSQAAVDGLLGPGCNANGGARGFGFNPDGTPFCTGVGGNANRNIVNYQGPQEHIATAFAPDSFSYNFEPDNILVLPLERWSMYTAIDLEVNDHVNPYVQAMFTNYNALQELAPTPAGGFSVPVTNPFIPASIAALAASRVTDPDAPLILNYRFNNIGGRTGSNTHDVWQLVTGTRGLIAGSWNYDVYGSWGRSVNTEIQGGNIRIPQTQALLNATDGGASLCAGGLNMFGANTISPACAARISLEAKNLTVAEQGIVEGVITGDLFELPAGTVQSAFGASYRHLSFDFKPDSGLQPGIVAGFNEQLPISGKLWYTDLFAEVVVPIVADLPFMQNLSTTFGVRTTDNNVFGSDETWKATFDWTVFDDLRVRGGAQHANRSPNIAELFSPQLNNFPNYADQDPCNFNSGQRTGANATQVQALCAAQATVAGGPDFQQPFGQAQAISGGNPDLSPETADSWSVGLVYTPQFQSPMFERVAFSVDYFAIDMEDVISAVGTLTIINRCYNANGANPTFSPNNEWCQLFNRDQIDGRVIDLKQFSRNQSNRKIRGVDATANWGLGVGPGELDFALLVSWLDSTRSQVTSVDPYNEFAGTIGAGTASSAPEWRGTLQTIYTMGAWQFNANTRYISSMTHNALVTNPLSTATGVDATWYVDLSATFDVTDQLTIRAGVNNVAGQSPRIYSPAVQANTDPSLYDVLGRRYFVGFNYRM